MAKEMKETKAEAGGEVKTFKVSIDTNVDSVIEWDAKGKDLEFSDGLGEFLELPSETVKLLSRNNRDRYFVSLGAWRMAKDEEEGLVADLKVSGRLSSASERLRVEGKDPRKHYCWKRPDELRQAGYEGYKVARGESLRSFGGKSGDIHRVGAMGEDELILMEMPKEMGEARLAEPAKRSSERVKNFDAASKESLGKTAFEGGGARGGQFTSTRKE